MSEEQNYFSETRRKLRQYIQQRMLLMRLQATEKISSVASTIITTVLMVLAGLFLLIFASITAGYWLADITGSFTMGFGIIAIFYLVLFLFVIFFLRKILQNFFVNKFIHLIHKKD